ncbi:type II toxin-antitoxin system RelE/ParE family toxin [Bradyrhizobium sp. USDA 377]
MNIRYTLPALADLDSILTYIAEASPQGAARVQKRIQDVIGLLLAHPEIGSSSMLSAMGLAIPEGCRVREIPTSSHSP